MVQIYIKPVPRVLSVNVTTTQPHEGQYDRVVLVYEVTDSADDGISEVTITLDQHDTLETGQKCYDTAISTHNNDHLGLRDQVLYQAAALDHFYGAEGWLVGANAMLVGD